MWTFVPPENEINTKQFLAEQRWKIGLKNLFSGFLKWKTPKVQILAFKGFCCVQNIDSDLLSFTALYFV